MTTGKAAQMSNNLFEQVNSAHEEITGERFCTTCQRYCKVANGGIWRNVGKNGRRWLCRPCAERRGLRIPSNEPR